MRYDAESGRIIVSAKELIAISRRGISRIYGDYDDEPYSGSPSKSIRRAVFGDAEPTPLCYSFTGDSYIFEISGEADKIEDNTISVIAITDRPQDKPRRDEIEEARGRAFILGYIYSTVSGVDEVSLSVTYVNKNSGEFATRVEKTDIKTLEKFYNKCISVAMKYARPEIDRVTKRLPSMRDMRFPFKRVRDGQSELVRSTYRALKRGESLYACAPTGTGKTVSVLYPAIKLIGEQRHEKVFYLTPKGTTASVAEECINLLAAEGAEIRAITLASKERACPNSTVCKRKSSLCPLADCRRIADATLALYDLGITVVTLDDVKRVAKEYSLCPYELELSYSELCDAVICDVNYLFDPRVYIRRYFDEGGRFSFLIDEAHNLAERAREMYSAELSLTALRARLDSPLLSGLIKLKESGEKFLSSTGELLSLLVKDDIHTDKDGKREGATHLSELPPELYEETEAFFTLLEDELTPLYRVKDDEALDTLDAVRSIYYDIKALKGALERFDDAYQLFIFSKNDEISLKVFSLDPGKTISRVLTKGDGAVFFSATLSPLDYYKSVLGGDGSSETLEALSPFAPECLSVSIMDKISTRYSERERTLPAVSRAIAAAISPRRGNYMVFAPSFEYLEALAGAFRAKYPKIKILEQRRDMSPKEKAEFLREFDNTGDEYLIGFCVLGGIYSEGIDLVGRKLIGAAVVGIGMPQLSYEREAMAAYYQDKYDSGKEFAYIYPGMNRVLQAAGRVIRHELDRGIIVLIDDRFDDPIYKKTIPALWRGMEYVGDAKELNERIKSFWREVDSEK